MQDHVIMLSRHKKANKQDCIKSFPVQVTRRYFEKAYLFENVFFFHNYFPGLRKQITKMPPNGEEEEALWELQRAYVVRNTVG